MYKGIPGGRAAVRRQVTERERTNRTTATQARRNRFLARIHASALALPDLMAARLKRRAVLA